MNTYDPMDCIVYRHVVREADPYAVPLLSGPAFSQLPPHYANKSLRNRRRTKRHLGRQAIRSSCRPPPVAAPQDPAREDTASGPRTITPRVRTTS